MKYPALIQIRNGSKRLPGKAMKTILGRPIIHYLLERIRAIPSIGVVIVATTSSSKDDQIAIYCDKNHIMINRTNSKYALDAVYHSIKIIHDPYVVKFWGDSPLIDPFLCEDIIKRFEEKFQGYDYISNNHPSTYPEGMQIEIINISALEKVYTANDLTQEDKEHVTPYLWMNPKKFKIGNIEYKKNIHDQYRIVLDYPEDYKQIKKIIEALYPNNPLFNMEDIMRFLDEHPEIKVINQKWYETVEEYNTRVYGWKKESS